MVSPMPPSDFGEVTFFVRALMAVASARSQTTISDRRPRERISSRVSVLASLRWARARGRVVLSVQLAPQTSRLATDEARARSSITNLDEEDIRASFGKSQSHVLADASCSTGRESGLAMEAEARLEEGSHGICRRYGRRDVRSGER